MVSELQLFVDRTRQSKQTDVRAPVSTATPTVETSRQQSADIFDVARMDRVLTKVSSVDAAAMRPVLMALPSEFRDETVGRIERLVGGEKIWDHVALVVGYENPVLPEVIASTGDENLSLASGQRAVGYYLPADAKKLAPFTVDMVANLLK